jgi:3-oxoacyl-[acyl-carrier-protein] synthase-3
LIGHQANRRILNKISEISGIPVDRCVVPLDRVGNTSAASTPLAMASAYDRIRPGDRVLLTAFGGGATWGSLALTWPDITVTDPH